MSLAEYPLLRLRDMISGKDQQLESLYGNTGMYFGYGRAALFHGLRSLGIGTHDAVLVPGFICNSALSPFHALGIDIIFYEVKMDVRPDIDNLRKILTSRTKALLAVNYFGFPQDVRTLQHFCLNNGLFFIEDNTQGFMSRVGDQLLGTFGDIGVISLRKSLPIPNGAMLLGGGLRLLEVRPAEKSSIRDSMKYFVRTSARWADEISGLNILGRRKLKRSLKPLPGSDEEFNLSPYLARLSRLSTFVLKRLDLCSVAELRRKNYELLSRSLSDLKTIRPLFREMSRGVVPLAFPALVESKQQFHRFCARHGIEYSTWPTYPQGVQPVKELDSLRLIPLHAEFDFSIFASYET